ncbi:beta-defensin 5-like [Mastomys coucha]|uniref:beta-defensin 5-like n=1 Tax=Mastomys coucha TaxID=35658 RepID=UPI001261C081|nr:beta-defensin 5-like [Mastomys coucha]
MRIHYLLFTFLLVLLSPLGAFTQSRRACVARGGTCRQRKCPGPWQDTGSCESRNVRCCKKSG